MNSMGNFSILSILFENSFNLLPSNHSLYPAQVGISFPNKGALM